MADIPLASIRIGYSYSVEIDFPAGFLQVDESVRTRFRRYVGDPLVVTPTDSRTGDNVTWELTEAQTADMAPGTYYAESELYDTTDPGTKGEILTDNRYV